MDPSRYTSRNDAGFQCVQACYWIGKYILEDKDKKEEDKKEKHTLNDLLNNFCEDFQVKDHPFTDQKKLVIDSHARVLVECLGQSTYLKFDESEETIMMRFGDLVHVSKLTPSRGVRGYMDSRFTGF